MLLLLKWGTSCIIDGIIGGVCGLGRASSDGGGVCLGGLSLGTVVIMMGCPGGGNEIRLKTVSMEATTDCMPPTSLRLRPGLILIHSRVEVYPTCTQTPPDCWRVEIYKVTNQKITTTDVGNSCG